MPESVKISELPARQAVSSDILPAVDSTLSQTVRVTAAQIAAIGGGPPGDNTVTTVKLVNKAVTYEKIQDTATTDVVIGRSSPGGGTVQEIPCTAFARGLLAAANSTEAITQIGGLLNSNNPTFSGNMTVNGNASITGTLSVTGGITGQLRLADGTQTAPSASFSNDTDTGMMRFGTNAIGLTAGGAVRMVIESDAVTVLNRFGTVPTGSTASINSYFIRAWANYYGRSPASMRGSNGFTSISRISTGIYQFDFNFLMPDANYAVTCNGRTNNNFVLAAWNLTQNNFQIRQFDNNTDSLWDLDWGTVMVVR